MATVSITGYNVGSPTLYTILVSFEGSSHQVERRYSEFLLLAREVEQETGKPVPIEPPAKGGMFSKVNLDDRRRGLEAMVRALTRSDECFATLAVQDFLELSRLKRAAASSGNQDWVAVSAQINELLAQAKKADSIQRHKLCLSAQSLLATAQKNIDRNDTLGARERIRRQHVLEECNQKISALRNDGMASPGASTGGWSERTASLLGPGPDSTASTVAMGSRDVKTGRVLGETSMTRAMDNQQLLMHQKRSIEDQDADLQHLRDAICRQRELGLAINDEILKQNSMLDDLDADVHRVNTKLNQAQRKTSKFL